MATTSRDRQDGTGESGASRGNSRGGGGNGRKDEASAAIKELLGGMGRFAGYKGTGQTPKAPTARSYGINDVSTLEKRGIGSYDPTLMGPLDDIPAYTGGSPAYGPVALLGNMPPGPLTPAMAALSVYSENTLADMLGLDPGVHTGGEDIDRDTNSGRYGGEGHGGGDGVETVGEASRARMSGGDGTNGDTSATIDILYGDDQFSDIRLKDRRSARQPNVQSAADELAMLSQDAAFQDKYLAGDAEAVRRMRNLQSLML